MTVDTSRCEYGHCHHRRARDRTECQRQLRKEVRVKYQTLRSLADQILLEVAIEERNDLPMPGMVLGSDDCEACLKLRRK